MLASEYTTPLTGTPYFRSVGIIKATDANKNRYNIAELAFERYDEQNFQYVFTPYWKLIEFLPKEIFSDIPGIDMSIKKEHYYRVNMTPSFISKRTPGRGREDIKRLLEEVELDYYDRFEWLLRTDRICGDDNFVVERKRETAKTFVQPDIATINEMQPGDKVVLHELCDIAPNRNGLSEAVFRLLQSGVTIHIEVDDITFSVESEKNTLYVLERMMAYNKQFRAMSQQKGITKAKEEGKYKGRKRIAVDMLLFADVVEKFEKGLLVEQQALESMGMSRSTFYRRMREWKKRLSE